MLDKKGNVKMPTEIGPSYSVLWRGKPPHMLAPDIPVWYRFLDEWKDHFINLYYDSLLGGPLLSPEERKDPMKRMWRALICKRTDAIAELKNEVWLIEVADHPEMRAVGQLITYEALWIEDPKIHKPHRKVLVANSIDPDIAAGLGKVGVMLYLV